MGSKWSSWALYELDITFEDGDRSSRYPKANEFLEYGNHPFLNTKNIVDGRLDLSEINFLSDQKFSEIKKGRVNPNDIIISTRGSQLGKVAFYSDHSWSQPLINAQLLIIRVKDERLIPEYLYLLLNSTDGKKQIEMLKSGSAQPQLPVRDLKKLIVNLPDINIQKKILLLHNSLDNKIMLNRQINQTLEQMAQALFKSWFVDFDPVIDNALDAGFFDQGLEFPDELLRRAEARKAARENADFKPLPEDIRQLFPAAFELCSEPSLGLRGWVPQTWAVTTVGDVFIVKGGSTPSTTNPDFWEGGDIHWTSPKDLSGNNDKILLTTERKITSAGLQKISSGLLPTETVLMSSRAPVGYLALTKIPTAINQGYIAITDTKFLSPEFTLYWLDSNMDIIKSMSGGTTFAEISKKTFRGIQLVIPNIDVVSFFSTIVGSYLSKITKNSEECSTLEDLRDYLLPKLINGELEVNS